MKGLLQEASLPGQNPAKDLTEIRRIVKETTGGDEIDPRLVDDVALNAFCACAEWSGERFAHSLHSSLRALASGLVTLSVKDAEKLHLAATRICAAVAGTQVEEKLRTLIGLGGVQKGGDDAGGKKKRKERSKKSDFFGQNIEFRAQDFRFPRSDDPQFAFLSDLVSDAESAFSLRKELTFDLEKAKAQQERAAAGAQSFPGPKRDSGWLEGQIKVSITKLSILDTPRKTTSPSFYLPISSYLEILQ